MTTATSRVPIPDSETAVDVEQLVADFKRQDARPNSCTTPGDDPRVVIRDASSSWEWSAEAQGARFSDASQSKERFKDILLYLGPSQSLARLDWVSLGELAAHGAKRFPAQLAAALRDLDEILDEAREEDFPEPGEAALHNAKRLLREMYAISQRRFEIYPTPDGEIAIDAPDNRGSSVLLLCDSGGGALCLVNMKGKHRRARYSTTETLPDGFIREAMAELSRQGD